MYICVHISFKDILLHDDGLVLGLPRLTCSATLPCAQDEIHNIVDSISLLNHCEDGWAVLPHPPAVPLHDTQISAHSLGQIALVHYEQITLCDTRASLAGDLVAA